MSEKERFRKYVNRTEYCWIWTGGKTTTKGFTYGMFHLGKAMNAHRVALLLEGYELPPGCHVHHVCENTLCVRPDHLRVCTPLEHIRLGSHRQSSRTHCKRGHAYTDRLDPLGNRRCWICHAEAVRRSSKRLGKAYFRDAQRRYTERKKLRANNL